MGPLCLWQCLFCNALPIDMITSYHCSKVFINIVMIRLADIFTDMGAWLYKVKNSGSGNDTPFFGNLPNWVAPPPLNLESSSEYFLLYHQSGLVMQNICILYINQLM